MVEDIINQVPQEILLREVIGKNIKSLRRKNKITQEKLANLANIDRVSIAKYETCKITISLRKLLAIANALKVTPNDLLEGWEKIF